MDEPDLFNYKAFQRKSATSKEAFESKKNKVTVRDRVHDLLLLKNMSNEQIANELNIPLSSACARVRELQILDLVEDSNYRSLSRFGKKVVLWRGKVKQN